MDISYLVEFVELAKRLSFTETSRYLGMNQPTLSKHIAALEQAIRMPLFDRAGNSLKLTKNGAALLPGAYQVIDAYNDFQALATDLRKNPPPRLVLYGLSDESPSTEILGIIVSALKDNYGTQFLEVRSDRTRTPESILDSEDADMVLDSGDMEGGLEERDEKAALMKTLPLVAFVDKQNPLSVYDELPLTAFKDVEFLRCEGVYIERSWCHIKRACQKLGFQPKTRTVRCSGTAEVLTLCANLGLSALLLADSFVERIPSGISDFCKPINIPIEDVSIPLFFRYKSDNDNPLLAELVAHLEGEEEHE